MGTSPGCSFIAATSIFSVAILHIKKLLYCIQNILGGQQRLTIVPQIEPVGGVCLVDDARKPPHILMVMIRGKCKLGMIAGYRVAATQQRPL